MATATERLVVPAPEAMATALREYAVKHNLTTAYVARVAIAKAVGFKLSKAEKDRKASSNQKRRQYQSDAEREEAQKRIHYICHARQAAKAAAFKEYREAIAKGDPEAAKKALANLLAVQATAQVQDRRAPYAGVGTSSKVG